MERKVDDLSLATNQKNNQVVEEKITETPNKPVLKLKNGGIELSRWENERFFNGQRITTVSYTLRKSWKNSDSDQWQEAKLPLNKNDLHKIRAVLTRLEVLEVKQEGC